MVELLALMQGNFGAIEGINRKFKQVLLKRMGGQDTEEKRKELAQVEGDRLKQMMFIPPEV
jgi:C4-type Zn-finger protein